MLKQCCNFISFSLFFHSLLTALQFTKIDTIEYYYTKKDSLHLFSCLISRFPSAGLKHRPAGHHHNQPINQVLRKLAVERVPMLFLCVLCSFSLCHARLNGLWYDLPMTHCQLGGQRFGQPMATAFTLFGADVVFLLKAKCTTAFKSNFILHLCSRPSKLFSIPIFSHFMEHLLH